ncbi:MAG: hypothetical protein AAF236_10520 [Verrucomicrobiota bacterium]
MSRYPEENVLVIPRSLFEQIGAFEGISLDPDRYLPSILDPAHNFFMSRDEAEDDPSHKQIIPYAIFSYGGRYLHYVRGGKSGEKRLAAKGSIGIGGHINDSDFEAASLDRDTYHTGINREIEEELKIDGSFEHRIVALINDDSNEVGQVHLGVVHLVELDTDQVEANESAIESLQFLSLEQLHECYDTLESWSQICVSGLDQGWREA